MNPNIFGVIGPWFRSHRVKMQGNEEQHELRRSVAAGRTTEEAYLWRGLSPTAASCLSSPDLMITELSIFNTFYKPYTNPKP